MIIGLTGKKGSGKDTIATHLIESNGFVRVAFADPLKESVAALFDISRDLIEQLKNDEAALVTLSLYDVDQSYAELSVREFLQRYGTEAHRGVFGDQFWLDATRGRITRLLEDGYRDLVFTDVRFDNEAELVRNLGGTMVEVHRPGLSIADAHASEQLPPADVLLYNDGTLADLEAHVAVLYEGLDR
jgi:hypothetical protein